MPMTELQSGRTAVVLQSPLCTLALMNKAAASCGKKCCGWLTLHQGSQALSGEVSCLCAPTFADRRGHTLSPNLYAYLVGVDCCIAAGAGWSEMRLETLLPSAGRPCTCNNSAASSPAPRCLQAHARARSRGRQARRHVRVNADAQEEARTWHTPHCCVTYDCTVSHLVFPS